MTKFTYEVRPSEALKGFWYIIEVIEDEQFGNEEKVIAGPLNSEGMKNIKDQIENVIG